MGIDRIQQVALHDKMAKKLEAHMADKDYKVGELFNIGLQLLNYMFEMKDAGWEVGAFLEDPDGGGVKLKTISFPHEEKEEEVLDEGYDMPDVTDEEDNNWGLDIKWQ